MKMLVSDYDKTFYTNEDEAKKNIEAVNQFINDGNIFVFATGRSFEQIKQEIVRLKINYNYLICNDGALILNNDDEVLYHKNIDPKYVGEIINALTKDENILNLVINNDVNKTNDNNELVNKLLALVEDEDKAHQRLKEFEIKYEGVCGYISRGYLNITEISVSKSNGIKILNETLQINKEDIYTIGDDVNDISMIKMYNGYMMDESVPELKKCANKECSSVHELIDIIIS